MKIALTQRILYNKGRAYDAIEHGWYEFLKDHTLYFIPNNLNLDFDKIAQNYDGLIITGGDDSALRRTVELRTASAFMKQIKPILGVCHGAFLLTDVLGGEIKEDLTHMDTNHTITYGNNEILVNSHHSNVISKTHTDATTIATDNNGNIECWIDNNISGVVWHPERMEQPWLPPEILNSFNL